MALRRLAFLVLLLVGVVATSRSLNDASLVEKHEQWMALHGRVYKDAADKEMRFKIFKANLEHIESFNSEGDKPYKLGVNAFTDLTNEEFRATYNGFIDSTSRPRTTSFRYENLTSVPPSIDWRQEGAVTHVKDQRNCRSCWAFSAAAAVEGVHKLFTGELISLSEQQLLDCDTAGFNKGCVGGNKVEAFKYIIQNNGITTETNYPYTGIRGVCSTTKESSYAAKITGYEYVPANSEAALLKAVSMQPVSVSIEGSGFYFQHYKGGVFTGGECGTNLNHEVTVVGYGTAYDGTNYWLAKNSYGETWGEQGYIRMQRDVGAEGLCGIAMRASYPIA